AGLLHRRRTHVGTDAEGALAGAGEDDGPDVTPSLELIPDPPQLRVGLSIEGVQHVLPVDRDPGHVAVLPVVDPAQLPVSLARAVTAGSSCRPSSASTSRVCSPS